MIPIPAFLATRAGKFAAIGLAVVLAVAGFLWWLESERDEAVEADRAAAQAEAAVITRKADERAHGAAAATTGAIQQESNDAKAAADASDDPLGAGLRSLRDSKGGNRPPAK